MGGTLGEGSQWHGGLSRAPLQTPTESCTVLFDIKVQADRNPSGNMFRRGVASAYDVLPAEYCGIEDRVNTEDHAHFETHRQLCAFAATAQPKFASDRYLQTFMQENLAPVSLCVSSRCQSCVLFARSPQPASQL
jgi:hypothetical protein